MYINYKKIIFRASLAATFLVVFGLGACGGIWFETNKLNGHISKLENTVSGLQSLVNQPGDVDFSLFWDAYNKLQENFIDPSKINSKEIIYGAIEGMAWSLKDPYTNFFDPEQAQRFQQNLSGSFNGIGVEIGIKKGLLTIIAPLKGTPGEKAGLKSGDIITGVNGQDTFNMPVEEVINLIRGQRGTVVTLTVARDGWDKAKDIEITRDTIKIPSIELSYLENGDTAYVQIYEFGGTLKADFEATALKIIQSSAKRIILDLRDNPGGYLDTAQDIAGWFLQKGQTVTIEDFGKDKPQQIFKTEGNSNLLDYPLVVLINQGSASASEILAGALRDNRNVKLIGEKSFGKGCVQQVLYLEDGSFLKITIANWLTPNGSSISDVGLTPDVKVDITDEDFEAKKDPQLDKALEIVNNLK